MPLAGLGAGSPTRSRRREGNCLALGGHLGTRLAQSEATTNPSAEVCACNPSYRADKSYRSSRHDAPRAL